MVRRNNFFYCPYNASHAALQHKLPHRVADANANHHLKDTDMNNPTENLVATAKVALEAAQAVATKAQASVEKLVDLNLAASKAAVSESFETAQALMSAKDPQALGALAAGLVKPLGEKTVAYAQEFQKVVADASAEFTKTAQSNMADVQKGFATLMGSATNNAPAGTESAMAFFNQAMTASQNAFKTAQTSAQQAVEAAQANFTAVSKQATDAVKKATKSA
jgi:phasin family protein